LSVEDIIAAGGGPTALARAVQQIDGKPLTQEAVSKWKRLKRIPLSRVPAIARATGLPRERIAPAFYAE
jgi:hypothetical protein